MANDEELDYISTSPFLNTPPEVKAQDEIDKPALEKIHKLLQTKIESYSDVASLDVAEKLLPIKEQLIVNQMVIIHLKDLQDIITTTLGNIKEKYNG